MCAHTSTHTPHHSLNQSAMDKKIMPLSFLECFLLYPFNYHHPSPTLTKHCLSLSLPFRAVAWSSGMSRSFTAHVVKAETPVLSAGPRAARGAHHSEPPSLLRCSHWPRVVQSNGEHACTQLAVRSASAIWHYLRCFSKLRQSVFVVREQHRKCLVFPLLLFIPFNFR